MNLDVHYRIGLGIILVGVAYCVAHAVHRHNQPPNPLIPVESSKHPNSSISEKENAGAGTQGPRIFLPPDITVGYLLEIFKVNTGVQGKALAAPYYGKWMKVSGAVAGVEQRSGGNYLVMIRLTNPPAVSLAGGWFDKRWAEKISLLRLESRITITGRLEAIGDLSVILTDAEMQIDGTPPN